LGKPEIKIPHLLKSNNDGEFRPHVYYGNELDIVLYDTIKGLRD
jgi:hypothetical protein